VKSRCVNPVVTLTPLKIKSLPNTPTVTTPVRASGQKQPCYDLTTPVAPAKSKKVVSISQPLEDPTPAVATRTRNRAKPSSIPEERPPSCLPTPAATAPSSPIPSPQTPGQTYFACTMCNKTMMERSLTRHYQIVHAMKRPLPATPSRTTGLTPKVKRGRVTKQSPDEDQPPPLLRHQTPLVGQEQEILPRRTAALIHSELNPVDSPSKNIRVAKCQICGLEMAKSLIPKHYQEKHSPTATRRTKKKVEIVTDGLAKVAVSTDTPEKMRNYDSPARPTITKETVGNIVSTFRRATRSSAEAVLDMNISF